MCSDHTLYEIDCAHSDTIGRQQDELRQLRQCLEQQKRELDILKAHMNTDITHVRQQILDRAAEVRWSKEARDMHKGSAPGGNIIADIKIIKSMENTHVERACKWQQAFTTLYGLPFIFHDKITHVRLIEICNLRMSIKTTTSWDEKRHSRQILNCDKLLESWIKQGLSAGFWDSPRIIRSCNELSKWSKNFAFEKYRSALWSR